MRIEWIGKHAGCIIYPGEYNFTSLSEQIWKAREIYNVGHKVNWSALENGVRAVGSADFLNEVIKLELISEIFAAFTGRGTF